MRIGVLSDTHGALERARLAVERMGPIDLLIHAGDLYGDAKFLASKLSVPVRCVVGNCDLHVGGPEEELILAGGRRILLTHGHRYRVRQGHSRLLARAREVAADIVVFGHTHVPASFHEQSILFFNPGSLGSPRQETGQPTYGVLAFAVGDGQPAVEAQVRALAARTADAAGVH